MPLIAVSVQALRGAHDGQRSFTVVDSDALPIGSVEAFLRRRLETRMANSARWPGDDVMRYRLTGGSVPFGGAQWERKDDDSEIARRVLNLLADRRMLWKDFSAETEEHCVTSASRTRDQIGVHLDNPEIGTELAQRLQLLQKAVPRLHGRGWPGSR